MKSFIETQKALLAEIQNGCKQNFMLAREQEEKEQRLQLSASMPEITITEPQPDEEPGDEPATRAQENGAPGPGARPDSDSDSDSEEEDGEEEDGERAEAPCPALVPPSDSLGSGDRSPPGSPSSPTEQRISVSSPGRGHKVFVVTRVESPPERAEPPVPPVPLSPPAPACPPSPPALSSPPTSPALPPAEAVGTQDPGVLEPQSQLEPPQAGPPLPNGLKPEFALALPPEPPPGPEAKAGSCGLEHGELGLQGRVTVGPGCCGTPGKHLPLSGLQCSLGTGGNEEDLIFGPHHATPGSLGVLPGTEQARCADWSLTVSVVPRPCAALRVRLGQGFGGDVLGSPHPCLPDWGLVAPSPITELSCSKNEKELEELLLEASQESGQETL